jgi:hypothetical protein
MAGFLSVNTRDLAAVATWKARLLLLVDGPAKWALTGTISVDENGLPVPDATRDKRLWLMIQPLGAMDMAMRSDSRFIAMSAAVDDFNLGPDSDSDHFFEGIEGMDDFRGTGLKHNKIKAVIMRSFRTNIMDRLKLGSTSPSVERQTGAFMDFEFHNLFFKAVVDNFKLEASSVSWCRSTKTAVSQTAGVPLSISFVHCRR